MSKGRLIKRGWRITTALIGVLLLWLALPSVHAQTGDTVSPPEESAFTARLDVQPPAVSPGDPITYILTLDNPGQVDHQVTVSATLPAGFELPLAAVPVGATYNLRSGHVQWTALITANSSRILTFPGSAPLEPRSDGRLVAYAALLSQAQSQNGDEPAPGQVTHLSATGWAGTAPSADFGYALVGQGVQFTNLSSGVGPLSFWWEFGDGTTSSELAPGHDYTGSGEYDVRLTVANPRGSNTASQTVIISPAITEEPSSPYEILVNDDTPAVGQPIYFSNLTEPLSVTIQWNFGDGATSSQMNPTYNFQQPGIYYVTRVLGEGATAIQTSRVLSVDYPPQAAIEVDRPAISTNELVTFNALSTAPEVMDYYWDFGDGNSASSGSVAHSYTTPGIYPVTLAVSNDYGVALDTLDLHVSHYMTFLPLVMNSAEPVQIIVTDTVTDTVIDPVVEVIDEPEPAPDVIMPADPLAQQMLQAINAEREAAGLQPLFWSDQLARSSQHHTDDMATNWFTGHYGSNGSRPVDRMRQASYTGDYAGECTAWGFDDLASAVAWWMTSPPHRVIILSTVATEIGGAYSRNPEAPSVHYWTIDFGAD